MVLAVEESASAEGKERARAGMLSVMYVIDVDGDVLIGDRATRKTFRK